MTVKCTSVNLNMLKSVLLSILYTVHLVQASNHVLGTALDYMTWVSSNGSLVFPEFRTYTGTFTGKEAVLCFNNYFCTIIMF